MTRFAKIKAVVERVNANSLPYAKIKKSVERVATPKKVLFGGTPQVLADGQRDFRFGVWTDRFRMLMKQIEALNE